MTLQRSPYQPNPGWGVLCEYCIHRDRSDLDRSSFPCRLATTFTMPDLARRGSADGRAEFGVDFQEDCSGYEYDGVS